MDTTPEKRKRFVYPKIVIPITAAGKYITNPDFRFDKNVTHIEGVSLTTDNEDKIFGLQQRLEINGNECLPQDFEARLLYAYASVGTGDRIWDLNAEPAGSGIAKITCFDTSTPPVAPAVFIPYTATFTFKCLLAD